MGNRDVPAMYRCCQTLGIGMYSSCGEETWLVLHFSSLILECLLAGVLAILPAAYRRQETSSSTVMYGHQWPNRVTIQGGLRLRRLVAGADLT